MNNRLLMHLIALLLTERQRGLIHEALTTELEANEAHLRNDCETFDEIKETEDVIAEYEELCTII